MSQDFGGESHAEVVRSTAEPGVPARSHAEAKVDCKCPGCERELKIRRKYFGTKVACKLCGHRFLARPSANQDGDGPGGVATELDRLVASFGRWKIRVKEGRAESAQVSQNLAVAMATLLDQSTDLAAIQDLIAALHEDLGRIQRRELPDPGVERQAIADEVVRRLALDRDAAEARWESIRREVDELRQRTEESERGRIEARGDAEAAEARLARFEQGSSHVSDQIERLEHRVAAAVTVGGEWADLREPLRVLTDQTQAIALRGDDQVTAIRASLAQLRAEQEGAARSLAAQADRQDRAEATLARLDAASVAHREEDTARWTDLEARASQRWLEVEALGQQVAHLVADQTGHRTAWDSHADRMAAIEFNAATAWGGVEAHRDEQALTSAEVREEVQRLREEVASLRSELAAHRSAPSAIPPTLPAPRVDEEQTRPHLPPEAGSSPIPTEADLDSLIWDLARERIRDDDHRPSSQGPPVIMPLAAERPPTPERAAPPLDAAGYHESALRYDQAMLAGQYPAAEREARLLVRSAAARIGESSLDHALWLRNLALSLLRTGRPDESRAALLRALAICESKEDRTPRIVCLLDLADYHGELRDFDLARQTGEHALALLDAEPNPIGPLRTRAQNLMARIGAFDARPLATNSIMISA